MLNNQFIRGGQAPLSLLTYLVVSILGWAVLSASSSTGKNLLCFRKYDAKRNGCKYLVSERDSSENRTHDIEICCSMYGQGYATQLQRLQQLRRKWYTCTPCSSIEYTDSYKSSGESRIKYSSNQENLQNKAELNSDAPEYTKSDEVTLRNDTKEDSELRTTFSDLMPEVGNDKRSSKDDKDESGVHLEEMDRDWGRWSEWGPCSRTCGPPDGTQSRYRRHCQGKTEQELQGAKGTESESECEEEYEQRTCQPTLHCTVDGGWGNWTISPCSVTCGEGGHQVLTRLCNHPLPAGGGADCQGDMEQIRPCIQPACPVDGGWSNWTDWTPCPAICSVGVQTRTRTCTNPSPENGGRPCRGLQEESAPCSSRSNCPVNGSWSEWSRWDICSARPCSGRSGHRIRFRTCTDPRPMFGGRPCKGRTWSREICYNNDYCTQPVNGGWCEWSNWTECSSEVQVRTRACRCPPLANGGTDCDGVKVEERTCTSSVNSKVLKRKLRTQNSGMKLNCLNDIGSGTDDSNETVECDEAPEIEGPGIENDDEEGSGDATVGLEPLIT